METKEKEINKLLTEYKMKLIKNSNEAGMILIDFAREYNKVWNE